MVETGLNTGEGKLYQEVELPRRPYSDTEAEMANLLSISPNYEAWCHLIRDPKSRHDDGRAKLVEYRICPEDLDRERAANDKAKGRLVAARIKERSHNMGSDLDQVKKDIDRRSMGIIESIAPGTAERILNDEE